MDGQLSFATLDYVGKKKRTKGDVFLAEMTAMPWSVLEAVIAPHYPKEGPEGAFCDLELGRDSIPDETTILNFRHLLEAHELTKTVFEAVAEYLEARGALLRGGTIVDATLIAASSSTKNEAGKRDPQMHSSKKGNQWCVSRTQATGLWCCNEDGSRPPEAGWQEQASNHPVLLRSKGAVVSDRGKVIP